ncbi:transcriptional regulator [Francisella halioticida]|uniref:Transcriptional regulator n=1 Tax=Francisella halioticida TaxID=549298 RepID=A0ABM6LZV1_9GAMM|nr:Rrf2 family transcriptional regulator [Francisella halioticida]ASG68243.1 transcriptional regulator [Francisella halioticida]
MNLTSFTDYSLRILIILGSNPSQKYKTKDLVNILDIKLNHATKIINNLSNLNYINSYKGRFGGISISPDTNDIKLSDIIRNLEPMNIVECFNKDKPSNCPLIPSCKLKIVLNEATNDFMSRLGNYKFLDICTIKRNI